jgi:hypothetical protein
MSRRAGPGLVTCYDALTVMTGVHSIGISKLSVPHYWDAAAGNRGTI